MIVTQSEPSPETHKPDTSATLLQQQIWYQDTGRPSLWHRGGKLINTAALVQGDETFQKDFYSDVLKVVQIVFPLETENFCIRVRTVGTADRRF